MPADWLVFYNAERSQYRLGNDPRVPSFCNTNPSARGG